MDAWLIYAILASLSWGTYIVVNKIAISKGMNPYFALVLMAIGIAGLFVAVFFINRPSVETDQTSLILAILAGALWALGQVFAILALVNNAPVSKLAPIYNTNTLVVVILGIILLKELPNAESITKVIIGAILIVVGGILVSG